jgi:hypothetical protein
MADNKQIVIRRIPAADYEALERMGKRLGLPIERFGRIIVRLVARSGPDLFQQSLSQALSGVDFSDEVGAEEEEAG